MSAAASTAIRGPVLTYTGDPFRSGLEHTMVYESDAIVAMADGRITHFGPADRVAPQLPAGTEIKNYGKDSLISAGFIDSHVHYPQTPMIGAFGGQLLDWLNKYTFPTELKYSDKEFARSVAKVFLRENLRNGITCGCVYCTVYPQSVDALFEEAEKLGMRLAAGKVMMDRNAPEKLLDTPKTGYDEFECADQKVARPRTADVRHHAALRGHQFTGAVGSSGRALQGASRMLHADARVGEQERGGLGQGVVPGA